MNTIAAALNIIKAERNATKVLHQRLDAELRAAEKYLSEQISAAGVAVNVQACKYTNGGQVSTAASIPEDVAPGRDIGLWAAVDQLPTQAGRGRTTDLLALRWRPASPAVHEDNEDDCEEATPEGWATLDQTGERYPTALAAVQSALARPLVARRVAEKLLFLTA